MAVMGGRGRLTAGREHTGRIVGDRALGGLVVLETERPKDVLVGTAIGALAGTGIGLVVGILEAGAAGRRSTRVRERRPRSLTITLSALTSETGEVIPYPVMTGTF